MPSLPVFSVSLVELLYQLQAKEKFNYKSITDTKNLASWEPQYIIDFFFNITEFCLIYSIMAKLFVQPIWFRVLLSIQNELKKMTTQKQIYQSISLQTCGSTNFSHLLASQALLWKQLMPMSENVIQWSYQVLKSNKRGQTTNTKIKYQLEVHSYIYITITMCI